jgi:uncharacterized protein (DUF2062 family)
MVFKRRDKLSWRRWIIEGVYPRSGWKRATSYIGHRLKRLPDTPHKIARGVGVGVYVSFTPFFGLHFVVAVVLAMLFRGNALAALLGTFFGNPVTFPFIATASLTLGHWILGGEVDPERHKSLFQLFTYATSDFWFNFKALFSSRVADWSNVKDFMTGVFLPYLVGGTGPGVVLGILAYLLSRPLISAYQKRRKGRLMAGWKERRSKAQKTPDSTG